DAKDNPKSEVPTPNTQHPAPPVTLAVAALTNRNRRLTHLGQVMDGLRDLMRQAKSRPGNSYRLDDNGRPASHAGKRGCPGVFLEKSEQGKISVLPLNLRLRFASVRAMELHEDGNDVIDHGVAAITNSTQTARDDACCRTVLQIEGKQG